MRKLALTLAVSIAVSGCASSANQVATAYVSPLQYEKYDCEQLGAESQRVTMRANQLAGRLDQAAQNDKVLVGVSLLLFWPAAFALGGTKAEEAEYARLKGESEAIHQAAIARKCPVTMVAPPSAHMPAPAPARTTPASYNRGSTACSQGAAPC